MTRLTTLHLLTALTLSAYSALHAGEDDHGLSDQLSAEAEALAPAFVAPAPAATTATARITLGEWGGIIAWTPHIPVTAATLPDGRLLTFSSNQRTTFPVGPEFTFAAVWDPKTGAFTEINNSRHDMFCGGTVMLPDGRLLVNGGRNTTRLSSIFNWRTNQWTAVPNMNDGRWYNTSVALSDGSVFTVTGDGGTNTAERWTQASGWQRLSGINWSTVISEPGYVTRWHPFIMLAPDGRLFHGGPTRRMNWLTASGAGSLTYSGVNVPGSLYPKEGTFAMYDEGRILVAGGSSTTSFNSFDSSTGTSTNAAFSIDIRTGTPVVQTAPSMSFARQFANSVVLPNGEVMIIGGNTSGRKFNDTGSILTPEIWNPSTRNWRQVAPMNVPRNYHSLALLLPDGRVWAGGGGLSGNSADHRDAQLFTPPQLFTSSGSLAARPVITEAPIFLGTGTVFQVKATPGVQRFTFIKMSSQTHSVNTDLRFLNLPFTETSAGQYAVTSHPNLNVMTPGYWMLFALNAAGAWSEASIIHVDPNAVVTLNNPGAQISAVNTAVSLTLTGAAPGNAPLTFSAQGLPTGLTLNPTTGRISGTPTAVGSFTPAITATDGASSATASFAWTITTPNLSTGFSTFTGQAGALQFAGSTTISNGSLRLTPNATAQGGSAYLNTSLPISANTSFTTRFVFRMVGSGDGADGMTFLLQNQAPNALGGQGGDIGYATITPSVAVEIDAHQGPGDPNGNHLGVLTNGNVTTHLATFNAPFDLENNASHTLWVEYNGVTDTLQVFLSQGVSTTRPAAPVMTRTGLDIASILGNRAWIGFTAATGGLSNTHEILAWEFQANAFALPAPPTLTTPAAQASVIGLATSLNLQASDPNQDPLTFSASGLPPGLSLNPNTGRITGTPTTVGTFPVNVSVTDGNTAPASASFTWTVSNLLTLSPITTSPVQNGVARNFTAVASGGQNPRFRWNFGDGSPTTAFSSNPSISRSFAQPGRYLITLTATDDTGRTVTQTAEQSVHAALTTQRPTMSSSILFEPRTTGNARVWAVNPDNDSVSVFDAVTLTRLAETPVGTAPRSLALAPDGRIWVSNLESSTLSILSPSTFAVVSTVTLPRGSRPFGIAFAPDASAVYVALEGSGLLHKRNPTTGALISSRELGQHARHVSVSSDSSRVYVSRFITPPLPGENTASVTTTGRGGEIAVVNGAAMTIERTILLGVSAAADTPTSARGLPNYLGATALSPDGLTAWVPSKQDNVQRGTLRDGLALTHDQSVRAIASRINLTTQAEVAAARVDFDDAGMPSAALFDPWGSYLYVALETNRAVAVLDSLTNEEVMRFPVGMAPQGLALSPDGRRLFVQNFMGRSVSVLDVSSLVTGQNALPTLLATLPAIASEKLTAQILKGKQLFYDAVDNRLALQQYISCATCHNDGGHDGRTWDLTGFGEGLRNTITLRGHGQHGMLHWSGNFDEVHDFEGQIRTLAGGTGLMTDAQFNSGTRNQPLGQPKAGISADLDALAAYVTSLTSEANSPHRNTDGSLTAAALEGEKVFRRNQCATCHSGPTFTNSAANTFADIGTLKPASGKRLNGPLTGLDVPTLRGVWATAPYLHDGSAANLAAAVTAHNGVNLTTADLNALVAYLQQIDSAPASAPLPVTVQLASSAPASVNGAFQVTATFSHPVTGFTLSDLAITGGTASNLTGSARDYTFTITPTAAVTLSLPADRAEDATGLGNLASNTLSRAYQAPQPSLAGENIGFQLTAGSSSFAPATGIHTVIGAGRDIFFEEDGFHFSRLLLNGDGEIRARVRSFTAGNPWAKAGIMIRETTAAGSRHATAFITPTAANNGFGMVWRSAANSPTSYAGGPAINPLPNNWVRLVRTGNAISGFASADGVSWSLISTVTLTGLPAQVSVGLAVTSSDTLNPATATFDNVQITGAQGPVAPAATLVAPAPLEAGPFTVQVQFTQPVTGLTLSDFTVANATTSNLLGSATSYSLTLTPIAPGAVTLSLPAASVINASGVPNTASNSISVTFQPPSTVVLQGQDIGQTNVAGSTSFSGGTYTVNGSGSDVFFTEDGFQFALTQLTGDGEIRARVTGQTNTNDWAKAGVMIRESLAPDSRHAFLFTTPQPANNGFGLVWRTTSTTSYTGGPALNAMPNNWVRLVRSGSTLSAFASANGTAWTPVGSVTLANLNSRVMIGLAVTSTSPSTLGTATFDNVQIIGSQSVVAPTVSLTSAAPIESGPFTVQIRFSQSVTGLTLSDFFLGNATASGLTGSGATYSLTLTPISAGNVTAYLPAAAAVNAGGAGNTESNTLSVSFQPAVDTVLEGIDIGNIAVAGATLLDPTSNVHTLRGAGADIFFNQDGFHYALTQLTGDGEIRARVTSQTNSNPWAKAGVMIRENFTAGSRHATVFTTPLAAANGFGMVWRTAADNATSYAGGPSLNPAPNNWVRIVRTGDQIIGYTSANGSSWTIVQTINLSGLSSSVLIGLAVTSSSSFVLSTATFDNVRVVGNQTALAAGVILPGAGGSVPVPNPGSINTADADVNANGVNDLIEYAIGSSSRFDSGWWLTTDPATGRIDAHVHTPREVTDITFSLEGSSSLTDWQRLSLLPTTTVLDAQWQQLTWQGVESAFASTEHGLIRLRAAQLNGTSATTTPQAFQRFSRRPGTRTAGVNLVNPPLYAGRIRQITPEGALQIETTGLATPSPVSHYLEVIDGENAGHRLELTAVQADLLTPNLATPASTLSSLPESLVGARIIVRPHVTLNQLFNKQAFTGNRSAAVSDQVLFHTGQGWITYWLLKFGSLHHWVRAGDATLTPADDAIIPPGHGLMTKFVSDTLPQTFIGHVRTNPFRLRLTPGQNLLAAPWPTNATPSSLQLLRSNGFKSSNNPALADQIHLWAGDSNPSRSNFEGYFLLQRNTTSSWWTAMGSADLANLNESLALPQGRAFFLKAQPSTTQWLLNWPSQ
jgi:YVTN family beta-propeller protein